MLLHHGAIKQSVSIPFHKILESMRYKVSMAILLRIQVFSNVISSWWVSVSWHFEQTKCFQLQYVSGTKRMHSFCTTQSLNNPDDLDPQMQDSFIEMFQLLSNMMAHSCRLRQPIYIFVKNRSYQRTCAHGHTAETHLHIFLIENNLIPRSTLFLETCSQKRASHKD